MSIKEYNFHIPVQFNDGTEISTNTIELIQEIAKLVFGGWEIDRTPTKGQWTNPCTRNIYDYDVYILKVQADVSNESVQKFIHVLKLLVKRSTLFAYSIEFM